MVVMNLMLVPALDVSRLEHNVNLLYIFAAVN